MVQVKWTRRARTDLDGISTYVAQGSPFYAERLEKDIFQRSLILEQHPRIGHPVAEVNDPTVRELRFGDYRIIYWLASEDDISILAVVHSQRILHKGLITGRRTKH